MKDTTKQFYDVIAICRKLFLDKARDYGTSWTILRMPSVTDQIYIKAERIRSIQEKNVNKVGESVEGEFIAIINYCVIALMLIDLYGPEGERARQSIAELEGLENHYDAKITLAFETMEKKNHDYGEVWRKMRVTSITDLILMKILRIKQIEDQDGQVRVSEGVDANYIDMLNYAVFSLIKLSA